ncbi:hypothetical protein VTJ49DRAFT_2836 [Mycothermus thermophilus]|uniref:Aminoglycoside phosphotransferase domain-containing protein n=1 Tax=Humicola insolens TaxID=85995 RepID=A0ABR3V9A5_HUMIN
MSKDARAEMLRDLRLYLGELHSIRPNSTPWIGSCSGSPVYDHQIDNLTTCGPFRSVGEFHDLLVAPVKDSPRPDWAAKYRSQLPDTHEIRFAHGDLSWENILVDPKTGKITAIPDWEMAAGVVGEVMTEYRQETEANMDLEVF